MPRPLRLSTAKQAHFGLISGWAASTAEQAQAGAAAVRSGKEMTALAGRGRSVGPPPREVASCHLFLACADSSYMTGEVLHPNGGEMIGG